MIKSDNYIVVPFFWPQPAFLRDHYQPFTGSRHFATYIKALLPRFHNTHHAARTLNLPQDSHIRSTLSVVSCSVYFVHREKPGSPSSPFSGKGSENKPWAYIFSTSRCVLSFRWAYLRGGPIFEGEGGGGGGGERGEER